MREFVRPNPSFEEDLERLRETYPNIDRVYRAIYIQLLEYPEYGTPIPDKPHLRILLTTPIGNMPMFRVLYRYNTSIPNDVVVLIRIEPTAFG